MSALEGIADKLAEAVHVADVPIADMKDRSVRLTRKSVDRTWTAWGRCS